MKTKRDCRILIRISGLMLAALTAKAEEEGRPVAAMARRMLINQLAEEATKNSARVA
jgi:hypothetical protein